MMPKGVDHAEPLPIEVDALDGAKIFDAERR